MAATLTITNIFIAHAGAEKLTDQGYRYERDTTGRFPRKGTVITPSGVRYTVHVAPNIRYCGCPFFAGAHICKHTVWFAREIDHEDAVARAAEEWAEYQEFGRFDAGQDF